MENIVYEKRIMLGILTFMFMSRTRIVRFVNA